MTAASTNFVKSDASSAMAASESSSYKALGHSQLARCKALRCSNEAASPRGEFCKSCSRQKAFAKSIIRKHIKGDGFVEKLKSSAGKVSGLRRRARIAPVIKVPDTVLADKRKPEAAETADAYVEFQEFHDNACQDYGADDVEETEAQQALPRNAAELADKVQPESRFHVATDLGRSGRG